MAFPYLVAIGPASGSTPSQVLTIFDQWTLDRNLDDGCTFSFRCPTNSIPGVQIAELSTDIWLYRSSVLEQRFRIINVEIEWLEDGRQTTSVQAVCYRRLLGGRYVRSPLSYTGQSQGAIVWDLVSHAQAATNGNLGITLGSTGPAILRDRNYETGQNILEAITDLTQMENGLTWEIDGNLVLSVSQASLYPTNPQPVVMGVNCLRLRKPSGAARFANVAVVTGDAIATTTQINEAVGLAVDPRGRWERFRGYPQEQSQAALVEQADGILEESQSPQVVWQFAIESTRFLSDSNYEVGDFILLVEPASVVPSTANPTVPIEIRPPVRVSAQVITQSVSVSADGRVEVAYSAIQTPQRWDDVSPLVAWDDVSATISWDDLAATYLF